MCERSEWHGIITIIMIAAISAVLDDKMSIA